MSNATTAPDTAEATAADQDDPTKRSCTCRSDLEAKLTENFKASAPEASQHAVSLEGYGFAIVGSHMTMRPFMPYRFTALHPLKRGGSKSKSSKGNMMFSFCPFCGVKIGKGGTA